MVRQVEVATKKIEAFSAAISRSRMTSPMPPSGAPSLYPGVPFRFAHEPAHEPFGTAMTSMIPPSGDRVDGISLGTGEIYCFSCDKVHTEFESLQFKATGT